ncbi:MAG TPA: polysaccharide lyase 6 family protein [Isosphaeraceae bacterium]
MRRFACHPLALVLGTLSVAWPAPAADHPVATTAEIARVLKGVRPGDTISLRDGTWRDAEILFEADGTPQRPITLRARTPGGVILSGRSNLRIAGRHLVVAGLCFHRADHRTDLIAFRRDSKRLASHCRLTNCAVVDCNAPDGSSETRWVSLYGDHNRVDHCAIRGKTTRGATLVVWLAGGPAEHRIDHNHFGPRPELKRNGGETIRVGDSKTSLSDARVVVESNCFEACNGEAEVISNKSCANVYRFNTFRRCSGALTLRHGHRCVVEGNVFLGQAARGTGGVRIVGEDHVVINNYFADLEGDDARAALAIMNGQPDSPPDGYAPVKRAVVAFNTFVDCKETLVVGLTDEDAGNRVPPEDCTLANNLIVGRRGPLVDLRVPPVRFHWRGNLVGGRDPGVGGLAGDRLVESPLGQEDGELRRPSPTSPVIGAAEGDDPLVRDDIDGQPRPARKDVGCDQVATVPVVRRPLHPADVGPSWSRDALTDREAKPDVPQ